jgi:hypothetical protein
MIPFHNSSIKVKNKYRNWKGAWKGAVGRVAPPFPRSLREGGDFDVITNADVDSKSTKKPD